LSFERSTYAKAGKDVIQVRIEKEGFEPKYSAVASFGGETTFLDLKLNTIEVAKSEIRQSFELSRSMMVDANRLVVGKRFGEALTKVEKVIEIDPKNADAHAAKGSILFLMKDFEGASHFESVRSSLIDLNLRNIERAPASKGEN